MSRPDGVCFPAHLEALRPVTSVFWLGSGPDWGEMRSTGLSPPSFLEIEMAHGFSHLTARKRVRVSTGGGGFKQPRRGKPNRPAPTPDPTNGRGTNKPGGGHRGYTNPGRKGGGAKPNRRRAAIAHILKRRKALGKPINRAQARIALKRNIRSDKRHAAYKYDFAGDGSGKQDKDYGTKRWKKSMKRHGWTERGNRKNHGGGNGNTGPKGDRSTSADNPGNSQSSDSYGGPQSLSAADKRAERQAQRDKRRKRRQRRRNHSGNSG